MKRNAMLKLFGVAGAALILAGCGGSSTTAITSFAELSADVAALSDIPDQEVTATLPSGEASYTGVAALVETNATDVITAPDDAVIDYTFAATGRFQSDVNFDDGTISGRIFDFYEAVDPNETGPTGSGSAGRIDGSLSLDGVFADIGPAIVVGISAEGTLTKLSGATAVYDIQEGTFGTFTGADASGLVIAAEGEVQESGGSKTAALAILADVD